MDTTKSMIVVNYDLSRMDNYKMPNTTNVFSTDEFKEKLKSYNQDKYGVDNYDQSDDFKEKYKATMQERYGEEHYLKNPEKLKETQEKIKEKYGKLNQQKHLSVESVNLLDDKKWLIEQYVTNDRSLRDIASEVGVDRGTITKRLKELDIPMRKGKIKKKPA